MWPNLGRQLVRLNGQPTLQIFPIRGWHSLREKYLRKAPIFRIDPDGTYHVEGVSNKQHPIPVLWVEPQKVERVAPGEDGSGDLESLPVVDLQRPPLELAGSTLWEKAPPEVRRVLSLEFARRKKHVEVIMDDLVKRVQEHQHDTISLPVIIATMTVAIRRKQKDLADRSPHLNQAVKHALKIHIDHRRSLLSHLRETDYKKFEWLLEKLNIVYKPRPFIYENINRFVLQERLVDLWCDELKHYRLACYKETLEAEQPKFLRKKAEKLKWILEQEKQLGAEPTVTQAEIDDCYARAEKIEARVNKKDSKEDWQYHIYEKEVHVPDHVFLS